MSGPRSKVEVVKAGSRQLRGELAAAFRDDLAPVDADSGQLLKFHGLYQQQDRDLRATRRKEGRGPDPSFMVRSRIPGGRLTAEQYLVHDDLATRYGNGTLRITTRQDLQLHGVLKGGVRRALQAINERLITTFGACGDVVRNVMFCPVPADDPVTREIESHARAIAEHLLPRSRAYHELWLDGEPVPTDAPVADDEEPIYGRAYLPRKFKIAVARPGDNCVDVHTQDVGLVPFVERGTLAGFNVLAGGGLGMTHTKPNTFPRLADPLAFVAPQRVLAVVERIVLVQRDLGDRADRRHARLKYLIHDRGIDWFREEVERGIGTSLADPRPMPPLDLRLHLGWRVQSGRRWCLGLSVENGRVRDTEGPRLRTALRAVIERVRPEIRLTPHQNLLLTGIPDEARAAVVALLGAHGVPEPSELSRVRLHSMACPALPTCGLALAEAERVLPEVIDELERELREAGLADETLTVRMTGCPNGCARPYVADIGFVGRSLDRYVVLLGGRSDGSRLNRVYADLVPRASLVATVRPLLGLFRDARRPGESFGDFCDRVGIEALRAFAERHDGARAHG